MDNSTIEILKTAILMERRGAAFYAKVAEQTNNEDVRKIFRMMSEEEMLHIKYLSEQYLNHSKGLPFEKLMYEEQNGVVEVILNEDLKRQIAAASFEAAAISAAIDMETKAIEVYQKRSKDATDENEKEMYAWLANWEKGHHKILHELNEHLKEEIWYDNQFWPF